MKNYLFLSIFFCLGLLFSCGPESSSSSSSSAVVNESSKPAFKGDARAIEIADSIVIASGGQQAWDETEYLQWNFFGNRKHVWKKNTNDLIIFGLRDNYEIKMNLNSMTGTVKYGNVNYTQPDTLQKYLTMARDMWRNDSYWIFLPFKLQDSGVNLKYLGDSPHRTFSACHKLELTFDSVGKTPQNKYILTVHPERKHIIHWDYFENASDENPKFSIPWFNYQPYGKIMLSDNRGENYQLTEISTSTALANMFK